MTSTFKLKVGLRLLAWITLLAFAHEVIAGGYVPVGDGGGVPPSSTPSASTTTTSVPPPAWTTTSSVPQLDADTSCSNNPCLKAPGPPYRPRLDVEYSGSITEEIVNNKASDVIQDGAEKVILKAAPKIFVKVLSKVLPVVGDVFDGTKLGNGELPSGLQDWQFKGTETEFQHWNAQNAAIQQWKAKNAAENADRQNRIDFFKNLQKTNIEQKEKAKAEAEKQQFEAAKQQYAAQQENQGLQELVGTYLSGMAQYKQMKQQSTTASSPGSGAGSYPGVTASTGKCLSPFVKGACDSPTAPKQTQQQAQVAPPPNPCAEHSICGSVPDSLVIRCGCRRKGITH